MNNELLEPTVTSSSELRIDVLQLKKAALILTPLARAAAVIT